jgi:hypothetical protein
VKIKDVEIADLTSDQAPLELGYVIFTSRPHLKIFLPYNAPNFSRSHFLKHTALALSLFAFTAVAHAELGTEIHKICQSPEAMKLKGKSGSCQVVTAPKKRMAMGTCTGIFMQNLPCTIQYAADSEGGGMNLTCGTISHAPTVNENMTAKVSAFDVMAIGKKSNGEDFVINDTNQYRIISNQMLEISLVEDLNSVLSGSITIMLQSGKQILTDVSCH